MEKTLISQFQPSIYTSQYSIYNLLVRAQEERINFPFSVLQFWNFNKSENANNKLTQKNLIKQIIWLVHSNWIIKLLN